MKRGSWLGLATSVALCAWTAAPVAAIPTTYTLAPASSATLFVNNGTANLLQGGQFTVNVTGSVTADIAANEIGAFSISIAPNSTMLFCGGCLYGGVSSTTIVAATIFSSSPFSGSGSPILPGLFTYFGQNAEIDSTYAVGGGAPIDLAFGDTPIFFQVNSLGSPSGYEAIVTGQNLGTISGAGFGEPNPLTVSSNLTLVLVPEPGTATLLLLGLAVFALRARGRQN